MKGAVPASWFGAVYTYGLYEEAGTKVPASMHSNSYSHGGARDSRARATYRAREPPCWRVGSREQLALSPYTIQVRVEESENLKAFNLLRRVKQSNTSNTNSLIL